MKPIREQLREQAESIREWWAMTPGVAGHPRVAPIMLEIESPVLPMKATRNYLGRVNSDLTYAPEGCLLFRGAKTERTTDGAAHGQRTRIHLEYRERPWNHAIDPWGAWSPMLDAAGKPAFQFADFNEWLDALEPPCGTPPTSPDGPSPEPGSWRDRPSLL